MIQVEGFEEDSEDEESAGSRGNVNGHGSGSALNGGAAIRDGEVSEDERRNNQGNIPVRRVDQEDLFQECPNSAQRIMAGAEIMDVNVSRGVNRMSVSTDSNAGFQAQLEEIDNALNIFETAGGRTEVGSDRDQNLGVDRLGQMANKMLVLGPLTPRITRLGVWA